MNDAPSPSGVRFTRDSSASSNTPSNEAPDPACDSAYIPPRVEPLGTLPQSTGMPVSAFGLGEAPTR
jgi:hypothetical protein